MIICTAVIVFTDCAWFWIPDWAVIFTAAGNGAAWHFGLAAPEAACFFVISIFFIVLYTAIPHGIGSGDVKLAIALAAGCTGYTACIMVIAAFLSASVAAVAVWYLTGGREIPFGPFLWTGWWTAIFFGNELIVWML